MIPRRIFWVSILVFAVVALLPLFVVVASSFSGEAGFSLSAYAKAFDPARQAILAKNSFLVAGGATLFSLVIGLPIAVLLARTNLVLRGLFGRLCLLPILIPPYVNAVAFIDLFGKSGRITSFLSRLMGGVEPSFTPYNPVCAALVLALSLFPFFYLVVVSGLQSLNPRLEEAASLVCGRWGVLRKVTVPLLFPYLVAGAVLVFVFAIGDYGVPALLEVNVYPVEIFVQYSAFYDPGATAALSVPMMGLTLLLALAQRRLMGNRSYVNMGRRAAVKRVRLGALQAPAVTFVAMVLLASLIAPVATLVARSGSWQAYAVAFRTSFREIGWSVALAAVGATAAVALSLPLAYRTVRDSSGGGEALDLVTMFPLAVPASVIGVGLIAVWNRPIVGVVHGTVLLVLFGYVARFGPFAVKILAACVREIDPRLEEASLLSNTSWSRRVRDILVPLLRSGLVASWLMVFILCLGELGATILVVPPGKATVPMKIYSLMHYGANRTVAALAIILVAIGFLVTIACGVVKNITTKTQRTQREKS